MNRIVITSTTPVPQNLGGFTFDEKETTQTSNGAWFQRAWITEQEVTNEHVGNLVTNLAQTGDEPVFFAYALAEAVPGTPCRVWVVDAGSATAGSPLTPYNALTEYDELTEYDDVQDLSQGQWAFRKWAISNALDGSDGLETLEQTLEDAKQVMAQAADAEEYREGAYGLAVSYGYLSEYYLYESRFQRFVENGASEEACSLDSHSTHSGFTAHTFEERFESDGGHQVREDYVPVPDALMKLEFGD